MSSLIVDVVQINAVKPHPNGDALDIAYIKGWSCIVRKGEFKPGDKAVYFPVDSILPIALSDKLGVTKYLSNQRIRAAKLRGFISYGLLIPCENSSWDIGLNLTEFYGVTKYEPEIDISLIDLVESSHPRFIRYTDVENHKNFPDVMKDGETIVATEKLHGTNTRIGYIDANFIAGSYNLQLKEPKDSKECMYRKPLKDQRILDLLKHVGDGSVIFGETFGSGVMNLHYGLSEGEKSFRAFDLFYDDHYVDWYDFKSLCQKFNVPTVPVLYEGPYSFNKINEIAQGSTLIEKATHIKEGLVFKPIKERWDEKIGRVILKHKSDQFELKADKLDNDKH